MNKILGKSLRLTGVEFNGRLGNQLFQFCFLLYLKSRKDDGRFFFTNPHHSYINKYFDLGNYHNLTLGSKVYSIFTRILTRMIEFKRVYIQNIQVPKEVIAESSTIYRGFFQTDWYLKRITTKYNIKVKNRYYQDFQSLYGDIFGKEKTIAVHIRRTDYLNYGKRDISLPVAYFRSRLAATENLASYRIFFLSDDIEYVKSVFGKESNFIFSENSEIIDFQIIQHADIAIISNSSFSWWASYLSVKDNKVFAPKNWLAFRLGKEHPKGIMTDKFIWCDVL